MYYIGDVCVSRYIYIYTILMCVFTNMKIYTYMYNINTHSCEDMHVYSHGYIHICSLTRYIE